MSVCSIWIHEFWDRGTVAEMGHLEPGATQFSAWKRHRSGFVFRGVGSNIGIYKK